MEPHRQIEQAAAVWLARRDREDWGDADEAKLNDWLSASIAHRVAFIRLETTWRQTGRLKALAAGVTTRGTPPGEWPRSPYFGDPLEESYTQIARPAEPAILVAPEFTAVSGVTRARAVAPRQLLTAVAAALFLAVVAGVSWRVWFHQGTLYRTVVGSVEAVPMNDGSTITLNTDSGVRVAISDKERRVDLEKGEAFFEVAKDPKRPFVVRAGNERIVAVGTKFSVWRQADDVRVIVTEGRVRVEHVGAHRQTQAAFISAGSVAVAGLAGVLVRDKGLSDVEEHLSWRQGFVIFHETPLSDAVAEFNRYNTRQIVIDDSALASIRVGGNFRSNNADGFVRLLAEAFPIRVEDSEGRIVLRHQ
jgi:transmembrane sensor